MFCPRSHPRQPLHPVLLSSLPWAGLAFCSSGMALGQLRGQARHSTEHSVSTCVDTLLSNRAGWSGAGGGQNEGQPKPGPWPCWCHPSSAGPGRTRPAFSTVQSPFSSSRAVLSDTTTRSSRHSRGVESRLQLHQLFKVPLNSTFFSSASNQFSNLR